MTTPALQKKTTITKPIFWSIAAFDAIGLFDGFIMMLPCNIGQHDGGSPMGWFFLFQVPLRNDSARNVQPAAIMMPILL